MFRSLPVRTISETRLMDEGDVVYGGDFPNKCPMSRDGSIIVAKPDRNNDYLTMNPVSGEIIHTWFPDGDGNIRLSADGTKLAVFHATYQSGGAFAGRVLIYDPRDGTLLRTINNPRVGTTYNDFFGFDGAISDDGNYIVINAPSYSNLPTNTNYYSRAFLFNLNTGALLTTFLDPVGAVAPTSATNFSTRVKISSDGSRIAISSDSRSNGTNKGYVYVYDSAGTAVFTKANPSGLTNSRFGTQIAFSSDGSQLLVHTNDDNNGFDTVTKFNVDTGATVANYTFTDFANSDFGFALDFSSDGSIVGIANKKYSSSYSQMRIFLYRHDETTAFKTSETPLTQGDLDFTLNQSGTVVSYSNNDAYDYSGNGGVIVEVI